MVVSATPVVAAPNQSQQARIPSRPTTPLRSASRVSLRASQTTPSAGSTVGGPGNAAEQRSTAQHEHANSPLAALEPAFAELSDSMADLEANFMHLQLLNESVARFNENFAAFLYGLNMTAFCVDFPEAPILHSFNRHGSNTSQLDESPYRQNRLEPTEDQDAIGVQPHDQTFLTTDTSFVVNPPPSVSTKKDASSRGASSTGRGRGRGRGAPSVAGTDANGRRTNRLPAASARGSSRGAVRGRGIASR